MALRLPRLAVQSKIVATQPIGPKKTPEKTLDATTAKTEANILADQMHELHKRFDALEAERNRLVSYYNDQLAKLNTERNRLTAQLLRYSAVLETEHDMREDARREAMHKKNALESQKRAEEMRQLFIQEAMMLNVEPS